MKFITNLFKNLRLWAKRSTQRNHDWVAESKAYGNLSEKDFYSTLKQHLPQSAILKKNILIKNQNKSSEIDFIIIFENKIFAIELKSWRGKITNDGDKYYQEKSDRYNEDVIHYKELKSPFSQLKSNIYYLKESTNKNIYINAVVFFINDGLIDIYDETVWFNEMDALVDYILSKGRSCSINEIEKFLKKLVIADRIYPKWQNNQFIVGIIDEHSLEFEFEGRQIKKHDIDFIAIEHKLTSDCLSIYLVNCTVIKISFANKTLLFNYDNVVDNFYLSRINRIEIGK